MPWFMEHMLVGMLMCLWLGIVMVQFIDLDHNAPVGNLIRYELGHDAPKELRRGWFHTTTSFIQWIGLALGITIGWMLHLMMDGVI